MQAAALKHALEPQVSEIGHLRVLSASSAFPTATTKHVLYRFHEESRKA
uniref:Uncharacterized protein n=1 Tax=Arundo donax TaxID=35708 RepID=A0A0A9EJ89_ARUDO